MVPRKLVGLRNHAGALCATLFFAAPLSAQERISPELFLDLLVGRTATFHDLSTGQLVGVEEFYSRNISVWRDRSNICVFGKVTIKDGQLCFLYDNDRDGLPVCWWTFKMGDRLLVRLAELGRSEIQEVVDISDETLSCPAAPSV